MSRYHIQQMATTDNQQPKQVYAFYEDDDNSFSNYCVELPSGNSWQFELNGTKYKTVEHAFQAGKALFFGDMETFKEIVDAPTPDDCSKFGRKVKNFNPDIWNQKSLETMHACLFAKFVQNEKFKQQLLSTKDMIIAEADPDGLFWGTGIAEDDPKIQDPSTWPGENQLGKLLMKVRSDLLK